MRNRLVLRPLMIKAGRCSLVQFRLYGLEIVALEFCMGAQKARIQGLHGLEVADMVCRRGAGEREAPD